MSHLPHDHAHDIVLLANHLLGELNQAEGAANGMRELGSVECVEMKLIDAVASKRKDLLDGRVFREASLG